MAPLHRSLVFVATLALVAATLTGGAIRASAATLSLTSGSLSISFENVAPAGTFTLSQSPDPVSIAVSSGGGSFLQTPSLFAGSSNLPSQLFTALPLISSVRIGAANGAGNFSSGAGSGGGFGGAGSILGNMVWGIFAGQINVVVPLSVVGAGGSAPGSGAFSLQVTGDLWTTGVAVVTGVTVVRGPVLVNTVTLTGSDARSAGHAGTLTLVSPIRILSGAAGNLPGFATQTLVFVPEPASLFLLISGAAILPLLRRSRR